jgi:lipopolysaccharide export system protein LptC
LPPLTRPWFATIGLLILTLLSWWLLERINLGVDRHETKPHEPDYYMEGMVAQELDPDGRLKRKIHAELMLHFPDDKSVELVSPRMEIHSTTGPPAPPWRIVAERGWINNGNEFAMLYGQVEIWREQANGTREVQVFTRDLRVLPQEEYAESDRATTIKTLTSTHRGVGIKANLRTNRIYLLSRVWSRYEASSKNPGPRKPPPGSATHLGPQRPSAAHPHDR